MNKYKKFTLLTVTCVLLCYVLLAGLNYAIDPFDVFHTKFLKRQFQMNERFMKVEFLEKNNNKYNSYMLGSSRIGTTNPKDIEKYIPNSKFYNFTISSSTQYDNLIHLQYFLRKGYEVKNLYLQVDIPDNLLTYKMEDSDFLRKPHPYIFNESLSKYYLQYLTVLPYNNIKGKLQLNIQGKDDAVYDLENTGMWFRHYKEDAIKEDPEKFIKGEPSLNENKINRTIKGLKTDENVAALKEIKNLCDKNNINLYVFIAPHNYNLMNTIQTVSYFDYLKKISDVVDFWDFSGYNSVTLDNKNYYESSHYRGIVGTLISQRIFNDTTVEVPSDFGRFVTKNNIHEHINYLDNQIKAYENTLNNK